MLRHELPEGSIARLSALGSDVYVVGDASCHRVRFDAGAGTLTLSGNNTYTGDTTIGLKGRIIFEAPGLAALLAAHRALEEAVLTKQQNRFKPDVARKWVELVYEGFFHDPLKRDLEQFLASSQRMVNGEVILETRGGRVDAVAVRSPHILNAKGATYAQSADWGVEEAEGFIKLFGMSSTIWAQVNRPDGT
mgnify:CR=1 FL=1